MHPDVARAVHAERSRWYQAHLHRLPKMPECDEFGLREFAVRLGASPDLQLLVASIIST